MTNATKPAATLVLITAEPTELDLDGKTIRAVALTLPNGARKLCTEGGRGADLIEWLLAAVNDPAMPRAETVAKKSLTDVASELLQALNGPPSRG